MLTSAPASKVPSAANTTAPSAASSVRNVNTTGSNFGVKRNIQASFNGMSIRLHILELAPLLRESFVLVQLFTRMATSVSLKDRPQLRDTFRNSRRVLSNGVQNRRILPEARWPAHAGRSAISMTITMSLASLVVVHMAESTRPRAKEVDSLRLW